MFWLKNEKVFQPIDHGTARVPDIKSEQRFEPELQTGNGVSSEMFLDRSCTDSPSIFAGPSENETEEVNKTVRKLLQSYPDPIEHSVTVFEKLGLREPLQEDVFFNNDVSLIVFDSKIALWYELDFSGYDAKLSTFLTWT